MNAINETDFPWQVAGLKFRQWYNEKLLKLRELFTPEWHEEYENSLPDFAFDLYMGDLEAI